MKHLPIILIILVLLGAGFYYTQEDTFGARTIVRVPQGGTGMSSTTAGAIHYGAGSATLLLAGPCSDNEILKYSSNVPGCASDATGGGGGSGDANDVWDVVFNDYTFLYFIF